MILENGKLFFSSSDKLEIRISSKSIFLQAVPSTETDRCTHCYFSNICVTGLSLHCSKTFFIKTQKDKTLK